jgi:hypothetical protein
MKRINCPAHELPLWCPSTEMAQIVPRMLLDPLAFFVTNPVQELGFTFSAMPSR